MLSIQNIVKRYAQHTALDGVSMEIPKGSIFGLLGPNGAGKTSLIRIINQITAPDSGRILMDGEPLNNLHINQIGYLPEERGLYKKMQVGEQVVYLGRLKGLSQQEAVRRSKHWFEKFEMQSWWEKKVEDLSKGMQQKVQFISTVLHDPELLILDEPFSGFDPLNAELVRQEIIGFHKQGKTIIFSTHRLENIEDFVTHIALLNRSVKILEGETRSIINQYRNNTYEVQFKTGSLQNFGRDQLSEISELSGLSALSAFPSPQIEIHATHDSAIFNLENSSVNLLLTALLPHFDIQGVREVIPSVSAIFISRVTAALESHNPIPAPVHE